MGVNFKLKEISNVMRGLCWKHDPRKASHAQGVRRERGMQKAYALEEPPKMQSTRPSEARSMPLA
uniref:Uncharacterized protein n=1 Tax=Cucumis melo TaxID=3656 RepID=A0A9I9DRJ6_CUCME